MPFRSMTLGATTLAITILAGCNSQPDPNAVNAAAAAAAASAVATQMAAAQAATKAAEHAAKAKAPAKAHMAQQAHESSEPHTLATTQAVARAEQVCVNCGVVEAVNAEQQKGSGTGLGAVAGGVLGGVLGHQVGGGKGKTAATVVGAIGGGLVGNEVEKRTRATTTYDVRVRMDDGSVRTLNETTAPAVGQRVMVNGNSLAPANAAAAAVAPAQQPVRSWQTSGRT